MEEYYQLDKGTIRIVQRQPEYSAAPVKIFALSINPLTMKQYYIAPSINPFPTPSSIHLSLITISFHWFFLPPELGISLSFLSGPGTEAHFLLHLEVWRSWVWRLQSICGDWRILLGWF